MAVEKRVMGRQRFRGARTGPILLLASLVGQALAVGAAGDAVPPPASAPAHVETSADFPGPMPLSWGFVSAVREAPEGKDVRVNDPAEQGDLAACHVQSETSLGAYGNDVYVGFNDARACLALSGSWLGFSRSTDGGRTFQDMGPVEPNGPIASLWGDPVIAIDTRGRDSGTIYLASLADTKSGGSTLGVARSIDRGRSFEWRNAIPQRVAGGPFHDKEWLAIDNTGGVNDGSLYLIWTQFSGDGAGIRIVRSRDGGRTWSAPVTLDRSSAQAARVAVGPDGEVVAVWQRFGALGMNHIMWSRSKDGVRFSKPQPVATVGQTGHMQACPFPRQVLNGDIRVFEGPSLAIDTFGSADPSSPAFNPYRGTAYVAFNAHGKGADEADVFFVRLPSDSQRWTEPRRINDDDTSSDQFFAEVVVTRPGRIAIAWTDRRGDPAPSPAGNRSMAQFITFSTDGGRTFARNRQLSDRAFPPPFTNPNSEPFVASCYAGDYNGLYAANGTVYASWGDNRDDLFVDGIDTPVVPDPNVYFRRLTGP